MVVVQAPDATGIFREERRSDCLEMKLDFRFYVDDVVGMASNEININVLNINLVPT